MSELIQVQNNGVSDDSYMDVLREERESLEESFEATIKIIDQLIEFYSLDPTDESNISKYQDLIRTLSKDPSVIFRHSKNIDRLEKSFQRLYRERLDELSKINLHSFKDVSANLETLYDQSLVNNEIETLERDLGDLKPIELDSDKVLTLDLSQDQLLEVLKIEKDKRARLSFLNERVHEPEIKKLEGSYDKWSEREKDLKRFLTVDLEKINKQIQNVKKTEGLDL